MFLLPLVAIFSIPLSLQGHSVEHVDCIELNHFYDQRGSLVYDQVIFWEVTSETGRFQVRAWCLADDRERPNRRPIKSETTGLYQVTFYDVDARMQRKITSRLYRESWTQTDPERDDKRVHPECQRVGLAKRVRTEE